MDVDKLFLSHIYRKAKESEKLTILNEIKAKGLLLGGFKIYYKDKLIFAD